MQPAMQRPTVSRCGATKWWASEVMLHPAISKAGARPWARAKAGVARTTQPAPSETTNPRRSIEKGRLARAGGSSACPGRAW